MRNLDNEYAVAKKLGTDAIRDTDNSASAIFAMATALAALMVSESIKSTDPKAKLDAGLELITSSMAELCNEMLASKDEILAQTAEEIKRRGEVAQ